MRAATIYSEGMFREFEPQLGPCADRLGIPRALFRRPDVELTIEKYHRLLDCAARSGHPAIGHSIGASMPAAALGPLGHAMAASATVRQMLSVASKYLYVFAHANVLRLDVGQDRFAVVYDVTDPNVALHQQDVELALACVARQVRELSGRGTGPRLVEFGHARPAYARELARYYGCEVQFDRGGNRLHYDRPVLDLSVTGSDPSLLGALEFFLAERLKTRSEDADLAKKVTHLIATSLSGGAPDIESVAATLGVSTRTLQRRLREQGLAFNDMVETVRRDIARQYVQQGEFSLTDVALLLGYSELSGFSRAFRRWTGKSPRGSRAAAGR